MRYTSLGQLVKKIFVVFAVMMLWTALFPRLGHHADDAYAQCGGGAWGFGLPLFDGKKNFWSNDIDCVIGSEMQNITVSPLEKWAWNPGIKLGADAFTNDGEVITDTEDAWKKAFNLVRGIVNYALWILALIALIYLIYHGILAMTAGSDDNKVKEWIAGVRFAWLALVGIAVSWFIVSLIIFLLDLFISNT
jgi:hypothetical protein